LSLDGLLAVTHDEVRCPARVWTAVCTAPAFRTKA